MALAWWERQGVQNIGSPDYIADPYAWSWWRVSSRMVTAKSSHRGGAGGSGIDVGQLAPAEREGSPVLLAKAEIQQQSIAPGRHPRWFRSGRSNEREPGRVISAVQSIKHFLLQLAPPPDQSKPDLGC